MNWETLFVKTAEAIAGKTTEVAMEKLTKQHWLDKLWKWFNKSANKKQKILVLGCSGVGKTHFINSLFSSEANLTSYPITDFTKEYPLIIDNLPVTFVDTAGQEHRDETRKEALKEEAGNIVGIINVVSYGYHRVEAHELPPTFEGEKVHTTFLKTTHDKELAYLEEWVQFTEFTNMKWVITLVNKMDIWHPDRADIQTYYASPNRAYKQKIKSCRGGDFKHHFVIPYSSALEHYYDVMHPRITPAEQNRLQTLFLEKLVELLTQDF